MPPANASGRITIDYRFVPAPHELILDPHVSPPAFRLWCVLAYMDWTHEPPSLPTLQGYLKQSGGEPPTRRSIYRWLGELEARGWIDWARAPGKAGMNDRITVKTRAQPATAESQPRKPVTPGSQPVIVESQVVTLRSQVDYFQLLSEPPNQATQNHEIHETHGGGDRARANRAISKGAPRHVAYLFNKGMSAAAEFAHLDPDTAIADFDARRDAGIPTGTIVETWRLTPPAPGAIYAPARHSAADTADPGRNGAGRGNGGADRARPTRAPRPGEPAYYKRRPQPRTDGTTDPE